MAETHRQGNFFLLGVGMFLTVLGSFFCYFLVLSWRHARETRAWHETPATIIESKVEQQKIGATVAPEYRLQLRYELSWEGKRHEGTRVKRRGNPWHSSKAEAEAEVKEFPVGKKFPCYVNPANPAEVVLLHETRAAGYTLWFPGLFVIGGLGISLGAVRKLLARP